VGVTLKAPWLRGRSYRMIDFNGREVAGGVIERDELLIPSDRPVYLTELSDRRSNGR
jgi:hypothetical protein